MSGLMILPVMQFLLLAIGIPLFGYRFYVRPAQIRARLGQPAASSVMVVEPRKTFYARVAELSRKVGKLLPSSHKASALRRELTMAGYRSENAPDIFLGLRALVILLLVTGVSLFPAAPNANPSIRALQLFGAAGIGWRVPGFLLKKKISSRHLRLRLALPDALDLTIISVEAGLSIDQAIQHVAGELRGPEYNDLSEELRLVGMEMRAGKRRAEALESLADRTGEDEVQKLVAILVQNDRFGTSMAEALRTHSAFMRVKRKQSADEKAAKIGVKLVFPIFFLILPSMMIVTAGPGLLQIFKSLLPMMNGIH